MFEISQLPLFLPSLCHLSYFPALTLQGYSAVWPNTNRVTAGMTWESSFYRQYCDLWWDLKSPREDELITLLIALHTWLNVCIVCLLFICMHISMFTLMCLALHWPTHRCIENESFNAQYNWKPQADWHNANINNLSNNLVIMDSPVKMC